MNPARSRSTNHLNDGRPSTLFRRTFWGLGWLMAGAILIVVFLAYRQPGFLVDLLNLRYCG